MTLRWTGWLTLVLALPLAAVACGGDDTPGSAGPLTNVPACAVASGNICTVAGTGIAGDGADEQPALNTRLYLPQDMTVGPDGRLYIVDWNNHRIRAVSSDGITHIVAGEGELGLDADDPSTGRLNHPTGVTFNADGLMVIAAWHNSRIKQVQLGSPEILDVCGNGKRGFGGNGGPAAVATLDLPVAVVYDAMGNMLIADQANQMVRIVDHATGIIDTLAGTGHCEDAVDPKPCVLNDDGPAKDAGFRFPSGQAAKPGGRIDVDAAGNIYVADTSNNRVRKIGTDGIVHTFAGTGVSAAGGDGGPAVAAQLARPSDVAAGPDGSLYIADTDNDCVRVVTPDGNIATFAGRYGQPGFDGDGGAATAAQLDRPYGVFVTPSGDVYVADTHNQRIRVVYH